VVSECGVCGFMRGGPDSLPCACDHVDEARALALRTLAANLAIGAALCVSWNHGWSYAAGAGKFRPGCQRPAP
jgi:hypothetical protein